MKFLSVAAFPFLIVIVLLSSVMPGLSLAVHPTSSLALADNQSLQVWFDTPYFYDAGPCEYQLVVHAQTSTGVWITNLHWDFGDGSTLDAPFSGESQVSDSRVHGYANAGTYVVNVTASDSAGNSGTGYWGLTDAFPTSCDPGPGTAGDPPPAISNPTIQMGNRIILLSGSMTYLYGFVTGGGASSGTFSNGPYQTVANANGRVVAGLAYTSSNTNSFSTQTSANSIGGVGVSGYSGQVTPYYNGNKSPGAAGVSVNFQVSVSNSLVVVMALGGDEQCLGYSVMNTAEPNNVLPFYIDATNGQSNANVITITHDVLGPGSYTAATITTQCAKGQTPSNAADLIGVFVFQPSTGPGPGPASLVISVIDAATSIPVIGASVVSTTPAASCTTGNTGACIVNSLQIGTTYAFAISATGYQGLTQGVTVATTYDTVTIKLSQSSANVCSQNGFISQPTISSGYTTIPTSSPIFGPVNLNYAICGPSSVPLGQAGAYAVILQLFEGSQLTTHFAIRSGTIMLSLNRRSGPNLSNPTYESYNAGTSSWHQINPLTIQYQEGVLTTAALGILGLIPGATGLIVGSGTTIAQLLGSDQTSTPSPSLLPNQFTDSNDNYISAFPIASWGTNQYAVVFYLSPYQAGLTQVYLWATVTVSGTSSGSNIHVSTTFSMPIQSPNYFTIQS